MLVAGVDLAAVRPSALALYDGANLFVRFYKNDELIEVLKALRPQLVAIDSPLSFPNGPWRRVDLKARRMGFKVLPPGWKGMRKLTAEGVRVKSELERAGIRTVETFPAPMRKAYDLHLEGDLRDAALCAFVAYDCLARRCYFVEEEDGSIALPSVLLRIFR